MRDPIFLTWKSEVATKGYLQVAQDLIDMLMAHKDGCVAIPCTTPERANQTYAALLINQRFKPASTFHYQVIDKFTRIRLMVRFTYHEAYCFANL